MVRHWLACLLLVVGCLFIYQDILGSGFLMFDDDVNFVYNEKLGPLSWERVGWIATEHSIMVRYVPVGWLFCCALTHINGLDPFWFHAASLGLHAGASVLLYLLLRRLGPRLGIQDSMTMAGRTTELLPLVLAGWWAWHPLRVETVSWVTPLIYLLATFLGLLALLVLLRSTEAEDLGKPYGRLRAGAGALYLAALLSHPAAISYVPLFVVVLMIEAPLKGGLRSALRDRSWQWTVAKRALPFVLSGLLALGLTMLVRQLPSVVPRVGTPSLEQFGILQRVAQGSAVLLHFLEKTLWPGKLNPAYPLLYQVKPWAPFFMLSMLATCGLLMVSILTLLKRLKAGLLALALLASCVPVLGLNETPYFPCDRYTHIPSLLLAVFLLSVVGQNVIPRRLCLVVGLPVLAGLLPLWVLLAHRQTEIWSSTDRLYTEIAAIQPEGEARTGYLCRIIAEKIDEGKITQARRMLSTIRSQVPLDENIRAISTHLAKIEKDQGTASYALLLNTQARTALKAGDRQLAKERLRRALALSPDYEEARYNLGLLLAMGGETREALSQFLWLRRQALSLPSQNLEALRTILVEAMRAEGQSGLANKLAELKH